MTVAVACTTYSGSQVQRVRTYVHTTDNSSATARAAMTQTSTDGLKTWQTAYWTQSTLVTTATVRTVPDVNGNCTVTVTYPDASSQVSQTTYQYDAHGRIWQVTDARNGTTTYTDNHADQLVTVTTPPPGNGEPGQLTSTFYDTSGRTTRYLHADGTTSTNLDFPMAETCQRDWGGRGGGAAGIGGAPGGPSGTGR